MTVTTFRTMTISLPDDIDRSEIERAISTTARAHGLECRRSGEAGDAFFLSKPRTERAGLLGFLRLIRGGKP